MRAQTAKRGPPRGTAQPRSRPLLKAGPWRYLQIVFVAIVLWAMDAVAQFHLRAQAAGLKHAAAVVSIGRDLGDGVAVMMNHWLAAHPLAAAAAAGYYIVLHALVTAIAGIVLIRHRHPASRLHRNVLIAASAMGTIVFWLYPVAPPRMLPRYSDTAATVVPFFSRSSRARPPTSSGHCRPCMSPRRYGWRSRPKRWCAARLCGPPFGPTPP